jgi:Spy/CpxP family protein refolding chaperone
VKTKIATIALGLLMAAPALAQTPPPPPPGAPDAPQRAWHRGDRGPMRMFQSLSPEGRQIMMEAMKGAREDWNRDDLRQARDKVATILSADKLDVPALRNAMDAERRIVDAQHKARQDAMLGAFQKLSAADRKAFVADAKAGRDRIAKRVGRVPVSN